MPWTKAPSLTMPKPAGSPGCEAALPCAADLNADGVVDGIDLGILLSAWTV